VTGPEARTPGPEARTPVAALRVSLPFPSRKSAALGPVVDVRYVLPWTAERIVARGDLRDLRTLAREARRVASAGGPRALGDPAIGLASPTGFETLLTGLGSESANPRRLGGSSWLPDAA
jgi:hypothetical protein